MPQNWSMYGRLAVWFCTGSAGKASDARAFPCGSLDLSCPAQSRCGLGWHKECAPAGEKPANEEGRRAEKISSSCAPDSEVDFWVLRARSDPAHATCMNEKPSQRRGQKRRLSTRRTSRVLRPVLKCGANKCCSDRGSEAGFSGSSLIQEEVRAETRPPVCTQRLEMRAVIGPAGWPQAGMARWCLEGPP